MMQIVSTLLLLYFLIPILVDSRITRQNSRIYCYPETEEGCKAEIDKKKDFLSALDHKFPPIKATLNNYTQHCQNVMKCASKLDCLKNKSNESIYEASCDAVGSGKYTFDTECMSPIFEKIYEKEYNCTQEFGHINMTNFTAAHSILKTGKQCIFTIAKDVCDAANFNFLRVNYDELIDMYTKENRKDIDYRESPSSKFCKMQCEKMDNLFAKKAMKVTLLAASNRSNPAVHEVLELSEETQTCKETCMAFETESHKNESKISMDTLHALPSNLTEIFKHRPRLLEYKCSKNITLSNLFSEQTTCIKYVKAQNCVMTIISKLCKEEILADFGNLTVSTGPRKELYNTPEFAFSMFRDKKNMKKFVFTVKD